MVRNIYQYIIYDEYNKYCIKKYIIHNVYLLLVKNYLGSIIIVKIQSVYVKPCILYALSKYVTLFIYLVLLCLYVFYDHVFV